MSASPADALDQMLAYHGRVREQLTHLRAIAGALQAGDADLKAEARGLADTVVRTFGLERILHEQDEVESLLPRVAEALESAGEKSEAVRRDIAGMAEEHEEWEAVWRPIQFWLWMVTVDDPIVTAEEIADACATVETHLLGHIGREEATVYATARRLLSAEEIAEMGEEMAERRRRWRPSRPSA